MFATRNRALGGSPTAEKLMDAEDAAHGIAEGAHAALALTHGRIGPALRAVYGHLTKVSPEMRGAVLDEARKIILNPDPAAVQAFAARLNALPTKAGTRQRVWAAVQAALPRAVTSQAVGVQ